MLRADEVLDADERIHAFARVLGRGPAQVDGHAGPRMDIRGGVRAVAAVQEVVPGPADQGVRPGPAEEAVVAAPPDEHVARVIPAQAVVPVRSREVFHTDQGVDPGPDRVLGVRHGQVDRHPGARVPVIRRVHPGPAVQEVVSGPADQDVVPQPPVQEVRTRASGEDVVVHGTDDVLEAAQHIDAGAPGVLAAREAFGEPAPGPAHDPGEVVTLLRKDGHRTGDERSHGDLQAVLVGLLDHGGTRGQLQHLCGNGLHDEHLAVGGRAADGDPLPPPEAVAQPVPVPAMHGGGAGGRGRLKHHLVLDQDLSLDGEETVDGLRKHRGAALEKQNATVGRLDGQGGLTVVRGALEENGTARRTPGQIHGHPGPGLGIRDGVRAVTARQDVVPATAHDPVVLIIAGQPVAEVRADEVLDAGQGVLAGGRAGVLRTHQAQIHGHGVTGRRRRGHLGVRGRVHPGPAVQEVVPAGSS